MRTGSLRGKGRTLEAMCWIVTGQALVMVLPFRVIASWLGPQGAESPHDIPDADARVAREISWRIRGACRKLPWSPSCLVRAVAAMMLLRRRGLQATLYLGVARKDAGLNAHAWVRCGAVSVTGGLERPQYSPLASFTRAR